ncbi:hypothetical protein ACLKA6_002844 [Drosophila palustris]
MRWPCFMPCGGGGVDSANFYTVPDCSSVSTLSQTLPHGNCDFDASFDVNSDGDGDVSTLNARRNDVRGQVVGEGA